MTPTLLGRWQTRFLLLATVGLFWTLPFWFFFGRTPPLNLALVLVLGFCWDILYTFLQKLRWDRDWPPAYQLVAGIFEGLVVFVLDLILRLEVSPSVFLAHYGLVWLATFLMSQGPLRFIFPRWRYRGGQWL
jgi:hypothetical protein